MNGITLHALDSCAVHNKSFSTGPRHQKTCASQDRLHLMFFCTTYRMLHNNAHRVANASSFSAVSLLSPDKQPALSMSGHEQRRSMLLETVYSLDTCETGRDLLADTKARSRGVVSSLHRWSRSVRWSQGLGRLSVERAVVRLHLETPC